MHAIHAIHHTVAYLHSNVPAFTEPENAAKQSRSKSRGLFSVDSIVVDGVTSQKISHLIS